MGDRVFRTILCVGAIFFSLAESASAITIADDANYRGHIGNDAALALGALPVFDSVVQIRAGGRFCTGTLISPVAVATARHCTDGKTTRDIEVRFTEGDGRLKQAVSAHSVTTLTPDSSDPGDYFNGTDFAIVTLTSAVAFTPYKVHFSDQVPLLPEAIHIVGYGRWGPGSTGAVNPVDYQRRGANNNLDLIEPFLVEGNATLTFRADFDSGTDATNSLGTNDQSDQEGLLFMGDSGGPMFVYREEKLVLGGVATGISQGIGRSDGDYGDVGVWTGFHSQEARQMLRAVGALSSVPLPASAYLIIAGFGLLAVARRHQSA